MSNTFNNYDEELKEQLQAGQGFEEAVQMCDADKPGTALSHPTGDKAPYYVSPDMQTAASSSTNAQGSAKSSADIKDDEDAVDDKDTISGSGVYFNMELAHIDQNENDVIITNAGKYKISVFFFPKFISSNLRDKKHAIMMKYNETVTSIVLEDDIDSIGMKGYIQVVNKGSALDPFIGRHNNYYLVITITQYANQQSKQKPLIKLQPYIFDIDYVENISNPQAEDNVLRLGLIDIVSSVLKTHSIASVIKFHRNITNAKSYKQVFQKIFSYVKDYFKINTNNKYEYKKSLLYGKNVKCSGVANSGYDAEGDMSGLIAASFAKIEKNASIMQALQILLKDCCTALKAPKDFTDEYMNIGNVLIPFFFKEELPDLHFLYPSLWADYEEAAQKQQKPAATATEPKPVTQPKQGVAEATAQTNPVATTGETASKTRATPAQILKDFKGSSLSDPEPVAGQGFVENTAAWQDVQTTAGGGSKLLNDWQNSIRELGLMKNGISYDNPFVSDQYSGSSPMLLCRQMTMRDIFMPFFLAFASYNKRGFFEDINPTMKGLMGQDDSKNDAAILGTYHGEIKSMSFHPIDMNSVAKLWKNVIFLDCSSDATCQNSTLIFFSWFFDFFQKVFLNSQVQGVCTNVLPDFFMFGRNQGIKHAAKWGNTFENKFDEYNSYTYATQTNDSVNECLRVMGKNLASFILINDMYTFTLTGNLFRRPNEIVKFGWRGAQGAWKEYLSFHTNLMFNDHTFLYVRKVIHRFSGNTYDNEIVGCKICEVLDRKQFNQVDGIIRGVIQGHNRWG